MNLKKSTYFSVTTGLHSSYHPYIGKVTLFFPHRDTASRSEAKGGLVSPGITPLNDIFCLVGVLPT